MDRPQAGAPDFVGQAQAFQARHLAFLAAGDLDGLVANSFTGDARFHSFRFRAEGRAAIKEVMALFLERMSGFGPRTVTHFQAGPDFIWQELNIEGPDGDVRIYEFKFLREGSVYLQLFGEKQGTIWQPGDFPGFLPPDTTAAEACHHRYIQLQAAGDADAMADGFFSEDARLVTARLSLEGRESLRSFFQDKFRKESGFHLVSLHNLTGDPDYVWFEATAASSAGARTVYDVMLLRDDRVRLQLVGTLEGVLPANQQQHDASD